MWTTKRTLLQINPYRFLRIIRICTDFLRIIKNPYTEKNSFVYGCKFLGPKNSKMIKFSWNSTILWTDVTHSSYITQVVRELYVLSHFLANLAKIAVANQRENSKN